MAVKVGLISLGCPKNTVDSETMLGQLVDAGMEVCTNEEDADVLIVNTCGFKEDAARESVDALLRSSQWKKRSKGRAVVAAGCLVQRYGADLATELPEVDAFVGVGQYDGLAEQVRTILAGPAAPLLQIGPPRAIPHEQGRRVLSTPPWTAYVRISDGCDYRCSFCTIPSIRGDHASRPIEAIVGETERLASEGVKEIVLVAQDSMRYGWDLYGTLALPKLLHALARVDGIRWIRVMYAYPATVTDTVIEAIASEPKVVKYLDIPLQHADRSVLKAMNRPGDGGRYLKILERFRAACPEIAIRSTFIVGHPGETPEAFASLKSFLRDAQLDRVGVFTFCREDGTPSAEMGGSVGSRTAEKRRGELMKVQAAVSREKNRRLLGQTLDVLVEKETAPGEYLGRSYRDAPEIDGAVAFSAAEARLGDIVSVRVTGSGAHDLSGTLASG
ncbi:MAG TPA: 30S ribosomal protein S12 methylthiotransferase RimO [Armatimonadota bacterium]|jgi:ribosomal protein S12 methylthiotransferase